ncbi:peptide ABC transporter ATP-binding protein [archaeon SCG-AAA382B04]|nr:peptide ABC transporter ATP-binding protein [archaeon SCG-AAA382B04]
MKAVEEKKTSTERDKKETILSVRNLVTKFYTEEGVVEALEGINFEVKKGEIYSLVGETGCGKSVTVKSILGLLERTGKVESGEAIFYRSSTLDRPVDLLSIKESRIRKIRGKDITYIPQDPSSSLNPVYTIKNQLLEIIRPHSDISKKEALEKAKELLEEVDLAPPENYLSKYPFQLSGGQKQRIIIAMALATEPSLIIADEPSTALDVTVEAKVLDLMEELIASHDTSLILITHNLGVVAQISDRIGIMYAGRVIEVASTENIFYKPYHPYTFGLLKSVPSIKKREKELDFVKGLVPDLYDPPSGCRFHPRCEYQTDVCKEKKPPYEEVEPGHNVACYYSKEVKKDRREEDL